MYKFDTESLNHARAALLLYALYRSRDKSSPLNGLETWDRVNAFARGACLKSNTTAEFVQNFCRKAKINSVNPRFLDTGEPVHIADSSEMVKIDGLKDYRIEIFEDNSLMKLYTNETMYIIMLVRERIQREKIGLTEDIDNENDD